MEKEFLINAATLANSMKTLKPFISDDECRYYLNGIFFEIEKSSSTLNMVATDGMKLCVLETEVDRQELFDYGTLKAIVPVKAIDTMLAMLKGVRPDCRIALRFIEDDLRLFVDTPDEKGEFRLIDGLYPEYRKVIPKSQPEFTIGFTPVQAKEALKAISTHKAKDGLLWEMTDEKSPLVIRGEGKLVVVMPIRVTLPGETVVDQQRPEAENDD